MRSQQAIVPYIFNHDHIMNAVMQESAHYAERKFSEAGDQLFENLVFDEEYELKFRELFFDAQANVLDRFSPYMNYIKESDTAMFEEANVDRDRDFTFSLLMPRDYNQQYNKSVSIKTREYLVAYIMYRWLETKVPQDAAIYKERAENTLIDARAYLEKRLVRRRMTGGNMF